MVNKSLCLLALSSVVLVVSGNGVAPPMNSKNEAENEMANYGMYRTSRLK